MDYDYNDYGYEREFDEEPRENLFEGLWDSDAVGIDADDLRWGMAVPDGYKNRR